MKHKNIILAATACMLILSTGAGSAWAYFTTYVEAGGGHAIELAGKSTVEETLDSWTKHVTVTNDAASGPVYIRVRAFAGSQYPLEYSSENSRWNQGEDGYYYYDNILGPGEAADVLDIKINNIPADRVKDGENFNVAVVYESTPVCYGEDGSAYADWTNILDNGSTEGGVTK